MNTVKQSMVIHLAKLPATVARGATVYGRIAEPDAPMPYATVQQINKDPMGHVGGKVALSDTVLQVDLWDDDESDVDAWAAELELAMDRYSGTLGFGATTVAANVFMIDETDFHERPVSGGATGTYRVSQDYRIWHARPIA
jgi:hypothetical protein